MEDAIFKTRHQKAGWFVSTALLCVIQMLVTILVGSSAVFAQDSEPQRSNSAIARDLSNPDPTVRRAAAEELARLAAVDQKKLLEGYYLQEKDREVRLALEWALYRVGKQDSLYRVVLNLSSSRYDQAVGYLKQLDSPKLIYPILKEKGLPPRITAGLLEALGHLGDRETLEVIAPYRDLFAPGVAAAAESAYDAIEARLNQPEPLMPGRPRTVSKTDTSP